MQPVRAGPRTSGMNVKRVALFTLTILVGLYIGITVPLVL